MIKTLTFKRGIAVKKEDYIHVRHNKVYEFLKKNKYVHEVLKGCGPIKLTLDIDWKVKDEDKNWLKKVEKIYETIRKCGFFVMQCTRKDKISIHAVHGTTTFRNLPMMKKYVKTILIPEWMKSGGILKRIATNDSIDLGFSTLRALWQRSNNVEVEARNGLLIDKDGTKRMMPIRKVENVLDYCSTFVKKGTILTHVDMGKHEDELYGCSFGFKIKDGEKSDKFEMIEELSTILDPKYVSFRETWFKMALALAHEERTGRMSNLFHELSKTTTRGNYNYADVCKIWFEAMDRAPPLRCVTIGTFVHYCRSSDPKKAEEILSKYRKVDDGDLRAMMVDSKYNFVLKNFIDKWSNKVIEEYDEIHKDMIKILAILADGDGTYIVKTNKLNEDKKEIYKMTKHLGIFNHYFIKFSSKNKKDVEKISKKKFIDVLNMMDKSRITYHNRVFDPKEVNPDDFNTWPGFRADLVTEEDIDMNLIEPFLNHIRKVMSNCNDKVYGFVLNWLAQIVQEPWKKMGHALLFVGQEGAGKGRFLELIRRVIGSSLVTEANDLESVSGRFNSQLNDKLVVCFNEVQNTTKKFRGSYDKLKSIITDEEQWIERKGVDRMKVKCCIRVIIASNNDRPIPLGSSDRRFCISETSSKHVGNKNYFVGLTRAIEDDNAINHFYTYLKNKVFVDYGMKIPRTLVREGLMTRSLPKKVEILRYLIENRPEESITPRELLVICKDEFGVDYVGTKRMSGDLKKYFPLDSDNNLKRAKVNGKRKRVYIVDVEYLNKQLKERHGEISCVEIEKEEK